MMWRNLGVVLLAGSLIGTTLSETKKFPRVRPMGENFFRGDDYMCGGMSATVTSGAFFEDLKSFRTKGGVEFRRNSRRVQTFPDELIVTVRTITARCTGPGDPQQKTANLERFDGAFIESLKFKCFWRHGFEMTDADAGVFIESEASLPASVPADAVGWNYEVRVKSAGVSLANVLILEVLSANGTLITRFSITL